MRYISILILVFIIGCNNQNKEASPNNLVTEHPDSLSLLAESTEDSSIEKPDDITDNSEPDFVLDDTFRLPLPTYMVHYTPIEKYWVLSLAEYVSYKEEDGVRYFLFYKGSDTIEVIIRIDSISYDNHPDDNARYLQIMGEMPDGKNARVRYFWKQNPKELWLYDPFSNEHYFWSLDNL